MKWIRGKNGSYWVTSDSRFLIEPAGRRFRLGDCNAPSAKYTADSVKEAKQLAKRVARKD